MDGNDSVHLEKDPIMKIKTVSSTLAFTFRGERVTLKDGVGSISDENGKLLIESNPNFTKVKSKRELQDA